MRAFTLAVLTATCFTLVSCGGKGDDKLGEQAHEAMENKADAIDAAAGNMTGPAKEGMEARADAIREEGKVKEEAIDDSDVNAGALTNSQKAAIVKPD